MGKATLKSFSAAQIDWEEVVQLEIPCEIIQ